MLELTILSAWWLVGERPVLRPPVGNPGRGGTPGQQAGFLPLLATCFFLLPFLWEPDRMDPNYRIWKNYFRTHNTRSWSYYGRSGGYCEKEKIQILCRKMQNKRRELTTQTPKLLFVDDKKSFEHPRMLHIYHTLPRLQLDPTFNSKRVKFLKD
jgi:hypothetical protein